MKKLTLTTAFLATALASFASAQPTNTPKNLRLVAVGYCIFEDEHSYNDFMYSPENQIPAKQGFHRLTVSNIQTGDFLVSNVFALHNWNTPTVAASPKFSVPTEIIELEMLTER
jgi:hypothetical protein